MAKRCSYSVELKRQVAQEYLGRIDSARSVTTSTGT